MHFKHEKSHAWGKIDAMLNRRASRWSDEHSMANTCTHRNPGHLVTTDSSANSSSQFEPFITARTFLEGFLQHHFLSRASKVLENVPRVLLSFYHIKQPSK